MNARRTRHLLLLAIAALLIAACSSGAAGGSPGASAGPSGTPGQTLTVAQLKLHLVSQLGPRWYCDPDFYPLARGDELTRASEMWPTVAKDAEAVAAILADRGLAPGAILTAAQKLEVYRAWKVLNSIPLDPIGGGRFRFDYLAMPKAGGTEGTRTAGTVDAGGTIKVEQQAAAGQPNCPICLARGTRIDTPSGPVAVEALRIGDPIWTLDAGGHRIAGTVIATGSVRAPIGHHVVRLVLADGRSVTASPGHPLADGRHIGDLRVDDVVDGSAVVSVDSVLYAGGETFDLIASGPTGLYLSDGIPLGSTLR